MNFRPALGAGLQNSRGSDCPTDFPLKFKGQRLPNGFPVEIHGAAAAQRISL
jgi:hypothetical protein